MRRIKILLALGFFSCYGLFAQGRIPVTETTLPLAFDQTAEVYYSFAAGDEIVFNMEMVQGKHVRTVEIIELPNNLVFSAFKADVIGEKRIRVRKKGLYLFRFYSSSLTNRVCRYKIDRIPSSPETRNFNTDWKWETIRDTVYTPYQQDSLVGYKTLKYQETERELRTTKAEEIMLFEKTQTVHSYYNENVSRTYLKVDMPVIYNTPLREESIKVWSYWIGVGQESREAYQKNLVSFSNTLEEVANVYYQNPLAAYAVGAISNLLLPQTGEDVEYYFISDYENVTQFLNRQQFLQFDMGKGRAAYGRNDRLKEGTFYIGLANDNDWRGIEVDVKIMVVKEVKTYEDVVHDRERQEPQYVKLNKTRMQVNEHQIRVPVE